MYLYKIIFNEKGHLNTCPCDKDNLFNIGNIYSLKDDLNKEYNCEQAKNIRARMFSFNTNNPQNYCQYCAFRRSQTLFEYLTGKKINQNDKYKHKFKTQRNSKEEITKKLIKFNKIFKDNEEDKWISALNKLRENFYKQQ